MDLSAGRIYRMRSLRLFRKKIRTRPKPREVVIMAEISNIIGILGVFLVVLAYFLLQYGKLPAHGFAYPVLNLLGALMIIFSLFYAWNLPSVIIETAWILVSLFGIVRTWRRRR